jgi:hypothetical protein
MRAGKSVAKEDARRRKISQRVIDSPGCAPLKAMYVAAVHGAASRWTAIESAFLEAMWCFDQNFRDGLADQGDNQNGKGDFFTDLIALLLENISGKNLYGRGMVPGLFFANHALDASYPAVGDVEVLIETKVAGAPKTPRNPKQKNPRGRRGSADLDKRIKEAGLKTIDLKAEWARRAALGGGPAGDLVSWLRRSRPLSFLFMAIRVVDANDLANTVGFANAANQMMDGVGLIAYGSDEAGACYQPLPVPLHLELDRMLSRVGTALRDLP